MKRLEALELLDSDSALDRLRAARALRGLSLPSDQDALSAVLLKESDAWVRSALSRIVSPEADTSAGRLTADSVVEDGAQLASDVRAQRTRELTAMVTHELEPLLGALRTSCMTEVLDFEKSAARRSISAIESFLGALRGLYQASGVPSISEFNLSDTVVEAISTVETERNHQGAKSVQVDPARSDPVTALGDPHLVRLALVNLLRNALEASDSVDTGNPPPVVVNWGVTDRDAWIAVLDSGIGLPDGASRMSEPGVSTKNKGTNSGMGLAVCAMALESMSGKMEHRPRAGGGVVAEIRWKGDRGDDSSSPG